MDHQNCPIKGRKGRIDILVDWEGDYEPTWEPMETIKQDDSVTLATYAQEKHPTHPHTQMGNQV